jgi:hypothetical protein
MEIASGPLAREVYLAAIGQVVDYLRSNGIPEILVAFGWGCDCPDDQLYQDVSMPLERLQPFIAESEAADYYRVANDNLHVKDPAGRCEFLLCHESDIHLITDDDGLLKQMESIWLANGYKDVYAKRGADWQKVVPVTD